MEPILSIIIPTHKRPQVLKRCLEHIDRQTVRDQLEVIIVSDGEDPETTSMMKTAHYSLPTTHFTIPKSQQGIARNEGVKHAKGRYVLFIGDDIFLAPHACEKHLGLLGAVGAFGAVLGFTTWDPAAGITPVMRWLEKSGWQFGYGKIRQHAHAIVPKELQHSFTYTSHISLPTEIARKFLFREDITRYGWEDIEWGWRLKEAGIPLFYEPGARALHHHHITLEQSLRRMEILGESAVVMERAVPELKLVPTGWKKAKYLVASLFPGMRGQHARAFLRGMIKN